MSKPANTIELILNGRQKILTVHKEKAEGKIQDEILPIALTTPTLTPIINPPTKLAAAPIPAKKSGCNCGQQNRIIPPVPIFNAQLTAASATTVTATAPTKVATSNLGKTPTKIVNNPGTFIRKGIIPTVPVKKPIIQQASPPTKALQTQAIILSPQTRALIDELNKGDKLNDEPILSVESTADWGGANWGYMHTQAVFYSKRPSEEEKKRKLILFTSIVDNIPCPSCRRHGIRHVKDHPLEAAIQSRYLLTKWTVDFHNAVNLRVKGGDNHWTIEQMCQNLGLTDVPEENE